ncbi:MAG: universal stress protein [Thermomicrobiales bacterium]
MNLFVPFDGSDLARIALADACRTLTPLDHVTVMAAVVVPASLEIGAPAGEIWKQICRAEIHLTHARAYAERVAHFGDGVRCVRVQARTTVAAIIAGAAHYEADTIVLARHGGMRGALASLFGPLPTIVRQAPCTVRVLYGVAPSDDRTIGRQIATERQPTSANGRRGIVHHYGGTTAYVSE